MANKNENTTTAMTIAEAVAFAKSAMSDGKKPTNAEVKTARENEAFALAVDAVAEKFGATEKGARNRASFPTITDEEWQLLPFAVREWKTGRWPYINGHLTHPMTSILTRDEAEAYYKAQAENEGKGTAHRPRLLPIADEVASINARKKDWELIDSVRQAGLTEAADRMDSLLPTIEYPRFKELFAGLAPLVLMGKMKVTLAWLMCRDKSGLRSTKADADMATLMAEGFFPTVMKPTLDGQVKELKDAGLDVTVYIDGWL